MRHWPWLISAAFLLHLSGLPHAKPPQRILPADEAAKDPELLRVRAELLSAARRGDLQAIWRLTDPNVQASWDERRGIFELRRQWGIDQSPQTFLRELRTVLSLGGRFTDTTRDVFIAPYIWFG